MLLPSQLGTSQLMLSVLRGELARSSGAVDRYERCCSRVVWSYRARQGVLSVLVCEVRLSLRKPGVDERRARGVESTSCSLGQILS